LAFAQAESSCHVVQVASRHAERSRGGGPVAAMLGDRVPDHGPLELLHRLAERSTAELDNRLSYVVVSGSRRRHHRRVDLKVLHAEDNREIGRNTGARSQDGTAQQVVEFTYVTRPTRRDEGRPRLAGEPNTPEAQLAPIQVEEVAREQRDVGASLA